jgi:hypothetical protein
MAFNIFDDFMSGTAPSLARRAQEEAQDSSCFGSSK